MRAFFLPIVLSALATPAGAQSLQVIGYSGYLGEWELTATVMETAGRKGWSIGDELFFLHPRYPEPEHDGGRMWRLPCPLAFFFPLLRPA